MIADPRDEAAGDLARPDPSGAGSATRPAVSSILVIQFRFLGDLVLVTSLLDNLKQHYPGARLSIVSDAGNAALLVLRPEVDFIPYDRGRKGSRNPFQEIAGWAQTLRTLRSRRFDLLIDCSNSRSGAILAMLSRAPVRIGYRPFKKSPARAYTRFASDWGHGVHYIDRFLSSLEVLGLPVRTREPRLRASAQTQGRVADQLAKEGIGRSAYVTVHLGARVLGRQWPLQNFADVIDALSDSYGLRTVIVGGPDEQELAKTVCGLSRSAPLNRAGAFSLEELVATAAQCRLFLGNDSGPMHVAAAAGAPVVALFGLQSPERWGPLGEGHVIVRPSMPCPCPFPDVCRPPDPQKTMCVRRITVDEVLDGVAILMRG